MQIVHHLVWRPTDAQVAGLLALGFDVHAPNGLFALDIDEADARWSVVRSLAPDDALDMVYTRATERERKRAAWLVARATGHHGFPQPADDFGFLAATYELGEYCAKCGVGASQRAPFRFRRDPALRLGRLLQLNWVFDVFFTTPETWERVFRALGVRCREVVLDSNDAVLASLVQLVTPTAPAPLALDGHAAQSCPRCGRSKYLPFTRGFMPAFDGPPLPDDHLVASRELFGSGASAHRALLVSAALYRAMRDVRVRGASFIPTLQPMAGSPGAAD